MRLLLVLCWLPLAFLGLLVLSPAIVGVAHVIFYAGHLRSFYGPWAEYLLGACLIMLVVFSIEYRTVLLFGLIPSVAFCWWMTC